MGMFRDWKYCTANDVSKETFQEIEGMVQDALNTERDVDIERECIKIAIAAYLTGCDCALTPDGEFMILKKSVAQSSAADNDLYKKYNELKSVNEDLGGQIKELLNEQVDCASAEDCAKRLKELGYAGTLTKAEILNIGD